VFESGQPVHIIGLQQFHERLQPFSCAARRQLAGIEAVERDAIVKALHDAAGNRSQAAAALGIARSSLYRKLKSYGISTI
jgi:transcriptional regulator of acetoin/glycerol metabolism